MKNKKPNMNSSSSILGRSSRSSNGKYLKNSKCVPQPSEGSPPKIKPTK